MTKIYDNPYFQSFETRIVPHAYDRFKKDHPYISDYVEELDKGIKSKIHSTNEVEVKNILNDVLQEIFLLIYDYLFHFEDHYLRAECNFDKEFALSRNKKDPFVKEIFENKTSSAKSIDEELKILIDEIKIQQTRLFLCHYLVDSTKTENTFGVNLSKLSRKFKVTTSASNNTLEGVDIGQVQTLIFLFSEYMAHSYLHGRNLFTELGQKSIRRKSV